MSKRKILIVDDEPNIVMSLEYAFKKFDFEVFIARDGSEAMEILMRHIPDVVLLDIMMPNVDGYQTLKFIREKVELSATKVVFLTAKNKASDIEKGLKMGADKYLIKPFSFHELVARIKAITRRQSTITYTVDKIGDLQLNYQKFTAYRADKKLHLSSKEFKLLAFFVKHQGEVLSRLVIAEHVWDINFESNTNVIDVAIRRLREKVDDPFNQKLIHTVRGIGYIMEQKY